MKRFLLLSILCVACVLGGGAAQTAAATDTVCLGFITGPHDNVVVPPGAFCVIGAAQVHGNVKVLPNGNLTIFGSNVGGNIHAELGWVWVLDNTIGGSVHMKADRISAYVCGNRIGGNVEIIESRGEVGVGRCFGTILNPNTFQWNIKVEKTAGGPTQVVGNAVAGNLQVFDNVGALTVQNNQVREDLQVYKSRGGAPKVVNGNTAGQTVQCFDNDPPFVGGPNIAPKREGQCF